MTEDSLDALIAELEDEDGKSLTRNLTTGLTDFEVIAMRRKYGWNRLNEQKRSNIVKFLKLFVGSVQFVMEIAALLAAGLQDWIDFGVICALLFLNAIVGFAQEYHAGNIVDSLKENLALKATVIRNGEMIEVPAQDVVPGDVVHVDGGTIVPADGTIVSNDTHLQVDQSSITGESLAVDKHQGDRCFSSSAIKRGSGLLIVTHTGDRTFVGAAAELVNKADNGTGHFTKVLDQIGRILLTLVVITLLVVWIASFYRSDSIVEILEYTLAITVVGVPVGLPAVVTTTMAVGASYLAKSSAIVQKLSAIESLAGVEVLCSDKTGTLTRNKLALGEPYTTPGIDREALMLTACLAATRKKKGIDAIDRVFIKGLRGYPKAKSQIESFRTIEFYPFDPVSKKVTAVVESSQGEQIICVKGAPIPVLNTVKDDQPVPVEIENAYVARVTEFASRGFRALGTIVEAQRLGLRIKMLTGDAVGIARETARQLGLGTNIYNAEKLGVTGAGDMPGSEVNDFVEAADGFAEVFPQHKYSVVEILQKRGLLVAMTGDGVNDAPSLKKADTGIAVEGASDAARSAADIVFLAPGLSAIITAIKVSRQIFHRMYAYVIYRIALSLHLEIFFGLWIATMNEGLDLRLVVLLAIFADIATLAIAYDNAPYSESPVKWNLPRLWGIAVVMGMILAAGSWIAFGTMLLRGEEGGLVQNFGARDSVLFLEIALTQNWLIFITRGVKTPFWKHLPSLQLFLAVLVVDIAATLMVVFGVFVDKNTSIVTIIRVWGFSLGVEVICFVVYNFLQSSEAFDNIMHGRSPRGKGRERAFEDFAINMQRLASQHEKTT
ncbi:Proton-exporting ATPase [Penicillium maclennaniae]|uniref:Proton-exporting ATPase n=1 Tax=Penicillium maclennaniae TaxID=1343394 RepID=UPI002541A7B7|nr:Proton-exporting ATPase [Penicillium maclennaniae]KAJ5670739.1 Proton-exporting ATPase [Penicillium maclennaniae]